jgi:hypothetical protein
MKMCKERIVFVVLYTQTDSGGTLPGFKYLENCGGHYVSTLGTLGRRREWARFGHLL